VTGSNVIQVLPRHLPEDNDNLSQGSWCPGLGSNQVPPDDESRTRRVISKESLDWTDFNGSIVDVGPTLSGTL
jgi:hypothetical protein